MIRLRRLIRIFTITIVTIFLIICIAVGVVLLMLHYHYGTEKLFYCYDFGRDFCAATRYYCRPYPPSDNWINCNKIKYVQRYLRNEKVKKIAFGGISFIDKEFLPDTWKISITDPEKIQQVFQLISSAQEDRPVYAVYPWDGRMVITTDKHKFVVLVEVRDDAVFGWDWKSKELRKILWEWGLGRDFKYNLIPKEQTVAILVYSGPNSFPLNDEPVAVFGNKAIAEETLFGVGFDKTGKRIMNPMYSRELNPKIYNDGRLWLEKIIDAYEIALKEAQARERYYPSEIDNPIGRILFIVHDRVENLASDKFLYYWNYSKKIGIDANTVYDDYIKSEKLKAYFDELGITKDLLAGKPDIVEPIDANAMDVNQ